ncbi:MAG: DUF305 domain-containing protein [Gemmatimonadales bacterium]
MPHANSLRAATCLLLSLTIAGAAAPGASAQAAPSSAPTSHDSYVTADVEFMAGMIAHHAQAVLIAGWAPTHGASPSLRTLCERIVVGQHDEIVLMQRWLSDHNETVPDGDASHDMMPGMAHMDQMPQMPGMLTPEQLVQLDQARGPAFDRLFLTFMIQHHRGAIVMVDKLFGSQGAGEEERIYRLASDVYADQTTEIERMGKMIAALPPEGRSP